MVDTAHARFPTVPRSRRYLPVIYSPRVVRANAAAVAAEDSTAAIQFGLSCAQGPREDMEDELCVIPDFHGSLYAGMPPFCSTCFLDAACDASATLQYDATGSIS